MKKADQILPQLHYISICNRDFVEQIRVLHKINIFRQVYNKSWRIENQKIALTLCVRGSTVKSFCYYQRVQIDQQVLNQQQLELIYEVVQVLRLDGLNMHNRNRS
ncbi:unnamed protein product [Paramecium sonneborni]|uniref:Uncharacterized protein n=1 Tax=Paramecium sonneborni TaxID=65129 RepID=A0A8S1M2T5_9CILI|nr:unnamed protein product [Paramecium sonneborni]